MKESPIIFNSEMVKAILDGCKTMTRRVMKVQPHKFSWKVDRWIVNGCQQIQQTGAYSTRLPLFESYEPDGTSKLFACPYGDIGDRLWVRETWGYYGSLQTPEWVIYRADSDKSGIRWKPSIFMPRLASRLTLEIVDVRVERVQDITDNDAEAEGVEMWWETYFRDYGKTDENPGWCRDPRYSFQTLWDSINAPRGFGWDANPWVWVIEFRRIESI